MVKQHMYNGQLHSSYTYLGVIFTDEGKILKTYHQRKKVGQSQIHYNLNYAEYLYISKKMKRYVPKQHKRLKNCGRIKWQLPLLSSSLFS